MVNFNKAKKKKKKGGGNTVKCHLRFFAWCGYGRQLDYIVSLLMGISINIAHQKPKKVDT